MRYLISSMILITSLFGCSKENSTVLNCDNSLVKRGLLNNKNASGPVYYSQSLVDIQASEKTANSQMCKATLSIQSSLDNKRVLTIPVDYTISQNANDLQPSTSKFILTADNQIKMESWIATLNALSKQLGDYQLTPSGALYVLTAPEQQTLYFNGQAVTPEVSNTRISIEKSYTLESSTIFLLGSYTGGSIDSDTRDNMFIQIDAKGNYKVTQPFAYQTITQTNESLVIMGIAPGRPYAESGDFPIYVYAQGELTIKQDVKPQSYYMAKFANLRAQDIVNQAKKDQCFDTSNNLLDTSHACRYAMKYCFEYKAMRESTVNQDYKILQKSCS